MEAGARQIVDTALSLDEHFYRTESLKTEARELIDAVKACVAEFSFETVVRDTPMIERVSGEEMSIVEKLDGLLEQLRESAGRLFDDDLRREVLVSAEWWFLTGTPLASCDRTDARMAVELQDLKYQAPDIFAEEVAELHRFDRLCALVLFGNDATMADLSPIDFEAFGSLELLGLAGNQLYRVPDGVVQNSSLRYLDLQGNVSLNLGADDAADWDLPNLEFLNVERCPVGPEFVDTVRSKYPEAVVQF